MARTHQRSSLIPILTAASLAIPVMVLAPAPADADVTLRVRGSVKVKVEAKAKDRPARVRVRHRHRHRTHRPRVRLRVGGGIHVHGHVHVGGFAEPPPPPDHTCEPGSVPAYYSEPPPPPPVYQAPVSVTPVVATQMHRPDLPRFGVGVFAGAVNVENRMGGEDLGLFGRLRLTDSLLMEAELAKTQMESARVDRRVGGALLYDLRPRSRFSAQILAGAGMTHVDMSDGMWQSRQEYGELGAGLSLRLTPRLQLAADIRAGARTRVDEAPADPILKSMAPSSDEEERYTRGRVSAIFYF